MSIKSEPLRADLVLEGGGVKGIGLVGAVSVLEEAGYEFPRVAGTSAGAIVASLVAARIPAEALTEIMRRTDYRRFRDKGLVGRIAGPIGPVLSLLFENGLYEGNYLVDYLGGHLDDAGVETFGDLLLDDDPESHLDDEERHRLVVMASDLSSHRLARLPWDYSTRYQLDPDEQDVALAVRASMAIPYFFEPYRLDHTVTADDGSTQDATSVLVDGGMLSNFPVEVFDRPAGEKPRWPTFGIKLSSRDADKSKIVPEDVGGPLGQFTAMVETWVSFHDALHVEREDVVARTIFIDSLGVRPTDFGIDRGTQQKLYESGRAAAERFLAKWNLDRYIAEYRTAPDKAIDAR